LAIFVLAFAAAPVTAASPTPLHTNLVKNPSAEAGTATTDGSGVPIPSWETVSQSNFSVVKYGVPGGPTKAESSAIHGGNNFSFAGRYDTVYGQCDDAIQNIKIYGRDAQIDSNHLKATLSAWVEAINDVDLARVTLTFGDDSNNILRTIRVGVQGPTTQFSHPTVTVPVPARTRQVTVRMYDAGTPTDYCDALFDKISVKLSQV